MATTPFLKIEVFLVCYHHINLFYSLDPRIFYSADSRVIEREPEEVISQIASLVEQVTCELLFKRVGSSG